MDLSHNERAHALRAALAKFRAIHDAGIEGNPQTPDVTVTMLGHKTAVPREVRQVADALGFEVPDVGTQSGEDYEYGKGLLGDSEALWTRMTFIRED